MTILLWATISRSPGLERAYRARVSPGGYSVQTYAKPGQHASPSGSREQDQFRLWRSELRQSPARLLTATRAPPTLAAFAPGDPILETQRTAEGNAAYRTRGGQGWP